MSIGDETSPGPLSFALCGGDWPLAGTGNNSTQEKSATRMMNASYAQKSSIAVNDNRHEGARSRKYARRRTYLVLVIHTRFRQRVRCNARTRQRNASLDAQ